MGLKNGYLKLVWSFNQGNGSYKNTKDIRVFEKTRNVNRVLPQAGFLSDGEWHVVVLRMDKSNVTLVVDRLMAYAEEPGLSRVSEDNSDIDLFLGELSGQIKMSSLVYEHRQE